MTKARIEDAPTARFTTGSLKAVSCTVAIAGMSAVALVYALNQFRPDDPTTQLLIYALVGIAAGALGALLRARAHGIKTTAQLRNDHLGKLLAVGAFLFSLTAVGTELLLRIHVPLLGAFVIALLAVLVCSAIVLWRPVASADE